MQISQLFGLVNFILNLKRYHLETKKSTQFDRSQTLINDTSNNILDMTVMSEESLNYNNIGFIVRDNGHFYSLEIQSKCSVFCCC